MTTAKIEGMFDNQQLSTVLDGGDDLLVTRREMELAEQTGVAVCHWCGAAKSKHCNDGTERCSINATSSKFRNRDQDDRDKLERALALVEELRGMG